MVPQEDGAEIQLEPRIQRASATPLARERSRNAATRLGAAAYQEVSAGANFPHHKPQNYARTALIEALKKAGVHVTAEPIGQNAIDELPSRGSYRNSDKVAELVSPPYSDYAKWILKVSYNIGADTSLVLFGLVRVSIRCPSARRRE